MVETSTSANPPRTSPGSELKPAPAAAGVFIGQYLLAEKLGEGGMGSVYRAIHVKLKKPFALKLLCPGHRPSATLIERFYHEMEAIGRLEHPNLVRATDAGDHEGKYFIVMEYVEGQDLGKILTVRKTLSVAEACAVGVQAAEGLQYLFDKNLVHRDIKPSNLLLTPSGQVKILDLGLALLQPGPFPAADPDDELTNPGQVMGTWDYIAPEQSKDSHRVDIRADIYSLGCTLYKLLSGQAPFGGASYPSSKEKVRAHQELPIPPIRSVRPDIPEPVERVLEKMLAKRPEHRFQRPCEVASALAEFAGVTDLSRMFEARSSPAAGTADTDRLSRWSSGAAGVQKVGRWVVTALALTGAALLAATLWTPRPPDQPPGNGAPHGGAPVVGPHRPAGPRFGEWFSLLDQEPVRLHWSNNLVAPVWNPKVREVTLPPHRDLGIVGLHVVPPNTNYRYRVTIWQPGWIGNVGIVFGFQKADIDGKPGVKYQTIALERLKERAGEDRLSLCRSRTVRADKGPGRALEVGQAVFRPLHDEEVLEIEVHGRHLLRVRWAGEEVPDLCRADVNDLFLEDDYVGAVGVWCHNNMARFRDAQIMYLER